MTPTLSNYRLCNLHNKYILSITNSEDHSVAAECEITSHHRLSCSVWSLESGVIHTHTHTHTQPQSGLPPHPSRPSVAVAGGALVITGRFPSGRSATDRMSLRLNAPARGRLRGEDRSADYYSQHWPQHSPQGV